LTFNVKQVLAPYFRCLRPADIVKGKFILDVENFVPFIDIVEGYYSSILYRQFNLIPVRNDDFLVHSTTNLADRDGYCYVILQNL
jgi:hypothetical protein